MHSKVYTPFEYHLETELPNDCAVKCCAVRTYLHMWPAKEHAHAHMVVAYVNDIGNLSSTGLLLTCAIISSTSLNADAYIFVVHTQLSHDRNSKVNAQRDVVPKIAMDFSNDFS